MVQTGSRTLPFFLEWERRALNPSTTTARLAPYLRYYSSNRLEWERRALNPSTTTARLAPYLRYYSSNRPLEDHGERPLVLIVFEDSLAEANFLGLARREMARAKVKLPLWVSSQEAIEKVGPLDAAWRSPDVFEPTRIFR